MAQNSGVPATHLAGLEKFAGRVFSGAQGDFSLAQYAYFDDTSLFSTAFFNVNSTPAIVSGTSARLFTVAVGDTDPVLSRALTACETNLEGGSTGGKMASNQAYVALAGGFDVYKLASASGIATPVAYANELHQIVSNISWSWNVGGLSNPTINYEPIKMWPVGAGVSGVAGGAVSSGLANGSRCQMRKFAFPLFFPPLIPVNVNLAVGRTCTFTDLADANYVAVAMHLRGYKLSQIRG